MNGLRVSLTERQGEIRGSVQATGDGVFRLEALALVVRILAEKWEVRPEELLNDLKVLVRQK